MKSINTYQESFSEIQLDDFLSFIKSNKII